MFGWLHKLQTSRRASAVHKAARAGNHSKISQLLTGRADVDALSELKQSALHIAILHAHNEAGDTDIVKGIHSSHVVTAEILIAHGANINLRGGSAHLTPLHMTSVFDLYPIADLLLKNGAEVDPNDNEVGFTPLHVAAQHGSPRTAELLIDAGANIEAGAPDNVRGSNGYTPLYIAAQNGQFSLVCHLVEKGANINARAGYGWTPLKVAHTNGHRKVCDFLKQRGAQL
jgi:ankyrin repeat protein